ncbi:MAG: hypothetical protein WCJ35_28920 [Planctomycetota bacterium]
MAQSNAFGEFSAYEVYTLEQVAAKLNRPRKWTYDTLIRPIDHGSKKRLLDSEGNPVPGVFYRKIGSLYFIPGLAMIAWTSERVERIED